MLDDGGNCFELSCVGMITGVRHVKGHNQFGWIWKKVIENTLKHQSSSIYVFPSVPPPPLGPQVFNRHHRYRRNHRIDMLLQVFNMLLHFFNGIKITAIFFKSNHLCISTNDIQKGGLRSLEESTYKGNSLS